MDIVVSAYCSVPSSQQIMKDQGPVASKKDDQTNSLPQGENAAQVNGTATTAASVQQQDATAAAGANGSTAPGKKDDPSSENMTR
jgi:hypothetical protein